MQNKNNLTYKIIKKVPFTEYHVGAIIHGHKRNYHSGTMDVAGMWFNENGTKSFSLTNLTKLIQEGYVQQIQNNSESGSINKTERDSGGNKFGGTEQTGGESFEPTKYFVRSEEPGDKHGGKKRGRKRKY